MAWLIMIWNMYPSIQIWSSYKQNNNNKKADLSVNIYQ